jgi:hypothetical protein
MKHALATLILCIALLTCTVQAEQAAPRPAATSLTHPRSATQPVDARGFIHRWLVLEPGPVDVLPRDGETAMLANETRTWHALDTVNYNLNLYHFAWALSKPTSNVLFWVTTTVDSPREISGVRLAIGSNAASRWWLNGEPVIALNDDRQTVIDDGVSKRLTLRKGRNVIRAAIINGGGATDFCARFLDVDDRPIVDVTASLLK